MERRKFIQQIALLSGSLIASSFVPAGILLGKDTKIKGRVLSNGSGLSNVVISDGYTVMVTDRKGKFVLHAHPEAVAIFISTPAGHAFVHEDGISRHYRSITEINKKKEINFKLTTLSKNDNEHDFIIWADPQVRNAKDVKKMMNESVPDVQKLVGDLKPGSLIHGITVGDIVWDDLALFADYDKAVNKMGIPFFQCLGNHDMDFRKGGDETSDDTFQKKYGPTYYSFNRGKAHYIVMDNVRYLGTDRDYDGFIQQHQLDWLEKDLSFVPEENLVILCMHIPVYLATKNRDALYALLQNRQVHIMSGHTHYHVNNINNNIYEHNHGTVCGAWWTGAICEDGTPSGYGVYKVNGTQLNWHYKSTGMPSSHQMKLYVQPFDATHKQVIVNIWNHDPAWKTAYWLDGTTKGALEQFEGIDPLAYATMLGPDLPKPRGFAEPKRTKHLFKAFVPAETKEIKIVATDRFGNQYTETARINDSNH